MSIAVDVVNLKGRILRQQAVARIGPARLPKRFALERDCRKRTDLIEGVGLHARNVLGNEHIDNAVAIEIAEAGIAAGAEDGVSNFFHSFGLGFALRRRTSSASRFRMLAAISRALASVAET